MANGHGGRRPGAGRPKGSLSEEHRKRQHMRQLLVDRVYAEFGPLADVLIDAAKGSHVLLIKSEAGWQEATDEKQIRLAIETGTAVRVVAKRPNMKAMAGLLDRGVGKVKEELELTGPDGGPIQIEAVRRLEELPVEKLRLIEAALEGE